MQNLVKKETLREDLEGILLTRYEETDDSLYTYNQNLNVRLQTLEEMKALITPCKKLIKTLTMQKSARILKELKSKQKTAFVKASF